MTFYNNNNNIKKKQQQQQIDYFIHLRLLNYDFN